MPCSRKKSSHEYPPSGLPHSAYIHSKSIYGVHPRCWSNTDASVQSLPSQSSESSRGVSSTNNYSTIHRSSDGDIPRVLGGTQRKGIRTEFLKEMYSELRPCEIVSKWKASRGRKGILSGKSTLHLVAKRETLLRDLEAIGCWLEHEEKDGRTHWRFQGRK